MVKVHGGSRKKTVYRYVAIVQEISEDEIELMGMKSLSHTKKVFKVVESDVFVADFSEIIAVLPNPKLASSCAQEYSFEKSIDVCSFTKFHFL